MTAKKATKAKARVSSKDKQLAARFAALTARVAAVEQKIKAAVDSGLLRAGNNSGQPPAAAPTAASVNQ